MLDALGEAADLIAVALASLTAAYDVLDEHSADRLEEGAFRPVQGAYGRARRTYAQFAERYGLAARGLGAATPPRAGAGARELIDEAVEAVMAADGTLATLQDSMAPVEYGDEDLRAGLTAVRALLGHVPASPRELVRGLGR